MTELNFELNPLWLVLFALVAGGFSFFLYFKYKSDWPSWFNKLFFVVRFVLVFFLLFLLVEPFVKSVENTVEKPRINVLVDNSSSVSSSEEAVRSILKELKGTSELLKESIDFEFFTLDASLTDSLRFTQKSTNISNALKSVSQATAGLNTVGTILISDGIVNQGLFLEGITSSQDVFTVGVGDTSERKDVILKDLFVNKSTFLGNEFPIQASVLAKGFSGKITEVSLLVNGATVAKKKLKFTSEAELKEVSFKYVSRKKGFLKVGMKVQGLDGEVTVQNNQKSSFVKVNESKQKVAFVARNPHPDIKAIVSSINGLEKYEVDVFNLSFGKKKPQINDYDIFILHQLPCIKCGSDKLVKSILSTTKPRWLINGVNTRVRFFNEFSNSVSISKVRGVDDVGGVVNSDFDLFQFSDLDLGWLKYAPPLSVPYASFTIKPESQVIMNQSVGTVASDKPLMVYKESAGVKELVMLGEGIWRWKMTESLEKTSTKNFDLLISKLMGLLNQSRKEDQFNVKSTNEQYNVSNQPKFSVISKNQLGELIYDNEINLNLYKEKNKVASYSFKVSEDNSFYSIPEQDTGVYSFTANTVIGGKKFKEAGLFSVEDIQLESKNLQADFTGLRELASANSGIFYTQNRIDLLLGDLKKKGYKNRILSSDSQLSFIDLFWPLLLLLLLVSGEWIFRKALGDI